MILAVSGWRNWQDAIFVIMHLNRYHVGWGSALHVRVGCATGVDKITREWIDYQVDTKASQLTYCVYRADWANLGKAAGLIRNGQMLRGENDIDFHRGTPADALLAFPQPGINWKTDKSGTVGCVLDAVSLGINVDIPGYKSPAAT